jgi:hypothetical protein
MNSNKVMDGFWVRYVSLLLLVPVQRGGRWKSIITSTLQEHLQVTAGLNWVYQWGTSQLPASSPMTSCLSR